MEIDPATQELCRVFASTLSLLTRLSTFYSVATNGLPAGAKKQTELHLQRTMEMYRSGLLAGLMKNLGDVNKYVDTVKQIWPTLLKDMANTAQSSVDAACIVYAHGILDASAYGYLGVTALASPESWESYVDKKKIELETCKTQSYEQIRDTQIQDFLISKVERGSLLYKLDLLHKIAPPPGDKWISLGYSYERGKLEQFDNIRHKIVHGNDWSYYSLIFPEEFGYWNFLNFYFLRLVVNKTGLKVISSELNKYMGHPDL